ncbi:MAG: SDR family NAD(P)-dependent oxidoreductase [Chloroflexi bacterium]|nr:SDR family NAD(P)-dependent oxidoreductase [Chloroflexota bacterium]
MPIFENQIVVIVGATGGLGRAIAHAFTQQGARVLLAARNRDALNALATELHADACAVDFQDAASFDALREFVRERFGHADVLVNATGADVRKTFDAHTRAEIQNLLDVNLRGAMFLTHALLPVMSARGVMAHLGGFADGRLALPYYTADAATRAGLAAFCEGMNRELQLRASEIVVSYFSPAPADTDAERPYHALWQALGIPIVPAERVAQELLDAIAKRKRRHVMGGIVARAFAKLNAVAPSLADALALRAYGKTLSKFFSGEPVARSGARAHWTMYAGVALVALSVVLYGALFWLPFVPLELEIKAGAAGALVVGGEIAFWSGGVLLGKEVVTRYRKYLDPRTWFGRGGKNESA